MKKLFVLSLAAMFAITVACCSAASAASYYKGKSIPPDDVLIKNLKTLQGPSSKGLGKQGTVKSVLGAHFMEDTNTYQLYYCYAAPTKDWIFGSGSRDDCFSDVIFFRLESNTWIMRNSATGEWIIITASDF